MSQGALQARLELPPIIEAPGSALKPSTDGIFEAAIAAIPG